MLLALDELKYAPNPFNKDNQRAYSNKEEKTIYMVDKPSSPPKLQRLTTTKDFTYIFPLQPRFIMKDIMKKGY